MMKQETDLFRDDGESLEHIFETTPIVVAVVYSPIYEYSRDYLTFIALIKEKLSAEFDSDIVKFVYLDIGFKELVMLDHLSYSRDGYGGATEDLTKDEIIKFNLMSGIDRIPAIKICYFGQIHSKFVGLCTIPQIRECLNSLL